jgi:hypothetical protein
MPGKITTSPKGLSDSASARGGRDLGASPSGRLNSRITDIFLFQCLLRTAANSQDAIDATQHFDAGIKTLAGLMFS